jgi:hypothetical protein
MMTTTTLECQYTSIFIRACLPEGAVAYISGFNIDGVTAGNDGGDGSDRRGLALHHLGIDDHDCGI